LFAMLLFLCGVLWSLPRALQRSPQVAAALGGSLLGYLLLCLTDNPMVVPRLNILFLGMCLFLVVLAAQPRSRREGCDRNLAAPETG